MWKIILFMFVSSVTLIGCNTEETKDTGQESTYYEPLKYDNDGAIERRGQIPTGKDSYFKRTAEKEIRNTRYGETHRNHDNDFNNEESMAIIEKVNELEEVTMSQAFTTDDRVYIAVMVNPYDRRDQTVSEKIRGKVEKMTDKKITIYTNNNNWDHMKDLNARLKASQAPDKLKNRIRDFFNQGQ